MAGDKYTALREAKKFGAWVLNLNPRDFDPEDFHYGSVDTYRVSKRARTRALGMQPGDLVFMWVTEQESTPAHFHGVGYVAAPVVAGFEPSMEYSMDAALVADDYTGSFILERLSTSQHGRGSVHVLRSFREMENFELFRNNRQANPLLTRLEVEFLFDHLDIDIAGFDSLLLDAQRNERSDLESFPDETGETDLAEELSEDALGSIEAISQQGLFNDDPTLRKETEATAIKVVKQHFEQQRLAVVSVEKENKGWDLEVFAGTTLKYRVEVKGRRSASQRIILTSNEAKAAWSYDDWYLALVNGIGYGADDTNLQLVDAQQFREILDDPQRTQPLASVVDLPLF